MSDHVLVLITCADRDEARRISRRLVEDRLAAGVQTIPINSVYSWQGEIVEDEEVLLIVKTRGELFDGIVTLVRGLHSYEVPPIVQLAIDETTRPYRHWIDEIVDGSTTG